MTNVWAFNWVTDDEARQKVYQAVLAGKSRFGWSGEETSDLRKEENWTSHNAPQMFLLQIRAGDWIVHINKPEWGRCVAARVTEEYSCDDGLEMEWGRDFSHVVGIDPDSVVEFVRNDPAIDPRVNLRPRRRFQRIYAVDEFERSIKRLREGDTAATSGEGPEERHLKDRTEAQLAELTEAIQSMHRGKALERTWRTSSE